MTQLDSWQVNGAGKNAIINGDFRIWQRGTSSTVSAAYQTADRFLYLRDDVDKVLTLSRSTDVPSDSFQYSMKLACTTTGDAPATTDYVAFEHRVEGYNMQRFMAGLGTLSFWVKSNKTGTYCIAFRADVAGTGGAYISEYTVASADTWEKKSVTVDFTGSSYPTGWDMTNGVGLRLWFTLQSGDTFHTTANTWINANKIATSNQLNFMDSTSNEMYITGVQLEVGSKATDFEFLDYADQLARCQRYYQVIREASSGQVMSQDWYSTGAGAAHWWTVPYVTNMRSDPTVTIPTIGSINKLNVTSWDVQDSGLNAFTLRAVGTALGRSYIIASSGEVYTADAEL